MTRRGVLPKGKNLIQRFQPLKTKMYSFINMSFNGKNLYLSDDKKLLLNLQEIANVQSKMPKPNKNRR